MNLQVLLLIDVVVIVIAIQAPGSTALGNSQAN